MRKILLPVFVLLLAACTFHAEGRVETNPDRVEMVIYAATFTPTPVPTATPTPSPTAVLPSAYVLPEDWPVYDGAHLRPGDTLCIPPGTRGRITFVNLQGDAERPITVRNCGGFVVIDGAGQKSVVFERSRHVFLRGNGIDSLCGYAYAAAEQRCGIRIVNGLTGITAFLDVSDLEIAYVEIGPTVHDGRFAAGVKLHSNSGAVFHNAVVRHSYIHDTHNEGAYFGLAAKDGVSPMVDALFAYNLVLRTGWNPLDWKQATGDILFNVMRYGGHPDEPGQDKGIDLVSSGDTRIVGNHIEDMFGYGIKTLNPLDGIVIRHNVIMNVTDRHILDRFAVDTVVEYNTLYSPGTGIDVRGTGSQTGNYLDGVRID